ncbi:unnamed protein product [Aphanomyces euteiches]
MPILPVKNRVFCTFSDCSQCEKGFKDAYLRSYRPNGLKVGLNFAFLNKLILVSVPDVCLGASVRAIRRMNT